MGMHNVKYDFSSLHIEIPLILANDIIKWGIDNVSDEDIYVSQKDPTFGREDEIHTTILYGLHDDTHESSTKLIQNSGSFKVRLGKTSLFTSPSNFDVLKIEVFSQGLSKIHEMARKELPNSCKHYFYQPHITIAYLKKGHGKQHCGLTNWRNKKFTVSAVIFSSKNGTKNQIGL